MDFAQLAQLIKPQQSNPMGGFNSGMIQGMQQGQMNGFLAKAAEQAEMEAKMKAMQAEEFALGAPMRRSEMDLKTLTNQQKLEILRKYGMSDEIRNRYTKDIETSWATITALNDATSEEEVAEILQNPPGPTIIGDMDLANMGPARAKKAAERIFKGRTEKDPKHMQEMEKVNRQEEGKKEVAKIGADKATEVARIRAEASKLVAAAKSGKISLPELALRAASGDQVAAAAMAYINYNKIAPALQQGANQAARDNSVMPEGMKTPTPTPIPGAVAPGGASASEPAKESHKFKVDTIYTDAKGKKAKYKGKDKNGKDIWEPVR